MLQGLKPYRKEPVLEQESFEYWEPKSHLNPYLSYFKNRNLTGTDTFNLQIIIYTNKGFVNT